jgi:hypothetical protein
LAADQCLQDRQVQKSRAVRFRFVPGLAVISHGQDVDDEKQKGDDKPAAVPPHSRPVLVPVPCVDWRDPHSEPRRLWRKRRAKRRAMTYIAAHAIGLALMLLLFEATGLLPGSD